MRRSILALPLAVALATVPTGLLAQVCIGLPVAESQNAVMAGVGFPESATSFGLGFQHNAAGPLSFGAAYNLTSYDNVDPKQHSLGVDASYELPGLSFSACPTVGLSYSRMSENDASVSSLSVPVGVGFGTSIELAPTASLIPHVVPQLMWVRATVEFAGEEVSDSDTFFGALFGATVATPGFYFGGGLMWVDQDNVDPTFSIMAGFPF
jgi:hypothetical protein